MMEKGVVNILSVNSKLSYEVFILCNLLDFTALISIIKSSY